MDATHIDIEFVFNDDKLYINFWDVINGNDLCAEFINGLCEFENGLVITFDEFLERARKIMQKWSE